MWATRCLGVLQIVSLAPPKTMTLPHSFSVARSTIICLFDVERYTKLLQVDYVTLPTLETVYHLPPSHHTQHTSVYVCTSVDVCVYVICLHNMCVCVVCVCVCVCVYVHVGSLTSSTTGSRPSSQSKGTSVWGQEMGPSTSSL